MSTQYAASWCLFHALCRYRAWRGTCKSISLGSLWLLSIQVNLIKILVTSVHWINSLEEYCLSLARTLTSRYDSRVDDRMQITTLSCNEGSIGIAPRISKIIVPETSVQYWHLLFTPPPAAKDVFHRSSHQWKVCGNWLWRFSFFYSPKNEPLRPLLILLFENDEEEDRLLSSKFRTQRERMSPVQYRSNSFFQWERFLVKSQQGSLLCGFAFAFDRHAKCLAFNFNAFSSSWSSGISVSLLFKFIRNLFDPWEILTQEWVMSLFKDQILISTPYLPCS